MKLGMNYGQLAIETLEKADHILVRRADRKGMSLKMPLPSERGFKALEVAHKEAAVTWLKAEGWFASAYAGGTTPTGWVWVPLPWQADVSGPYIIPAGRNR